MIGEATNCISAHSATKTPLIQPASALEPVNSSTRAGKTGMMMPIATMSSSAVTRMKAMAALRRPRAGTDMIALARERRIYRGRPPMAILGGRAPDTGLAGGGAKATSKPAGSRSEAMRVDAMTGRGYRSAEIEAGRSATWRMQTSDRREN
jgi:hypothetical protein